MAKSVISIENGYIYQKERLILSGVNFTIKEGEFVFLIGKTGSGKSSLLKTIYADLWLQEGKGFVADYPLHALPRHDVPYLRRKIGIVFQDFQLLIDRNIERNLLFFLQAMGWSNTDDMMARIHQVMAQVGLPDSLQKMPHQLSGGEQQRVSIARALLNDPLVIVADEPTGNLDPEMSIEILKLFMSINQRLGTAVMMATHDLELIERFPHRTLYCNNGRVEDLSESE